MDPFYDSGTTTTAVPTLSSQYCYEQRNELRPFKTPAAQATAAAAYLLVSCTIRLQFSCRRAGNRVETCSSHHCLLNGLKLQTVLRWQLIFKADQNRLNPAALLPKTVDGIRVLVSMSK